MKNNKIYEELTLVQQRALKIFLAIQVLLVLSILGFWKIQILDHKKYWTLSESNRKREVILASARGLIRDRNEVILANNRASFNASILRENCQDFGQSCNNISNLLNIEKEVLLQRINKYQSLPSFQPIVVKDDLSFEEVSRIESRKLEMPELVLQSEPKRSYPFGPLAAHVLGYLQELSPQEMKKEHYADKRLGNLIGKTGIEKQYDTFLEGTDGHIVEIVDSEGRRKGEIARKEPFPGNIIDLTIDYDLQKKVEELLKGREGAAVVMDARTGDILALASYPDYDPNRFINRFTPEEWMDLIQNPEFPLENRATRGLYSPGSVFKLTIALAALDSGLIHDRTSYFCSGMVRIYGHPFHCWFKPGHGSVNLYNGIKHSCNVYFYQLGKRLKIEEIHRYARQLGFGAKTGVDLPGEKSGLVPHPEWKQKIKKDPWYPGETISVSIGQGPLLVTPLQVASHTAIIANRGIMVTPHLLKRKKMLSGTKRKKEYKTKTRKVEIKPSTFEKVIKGMWLAVNDGGTGRATKIYGYDVCGKTGSTQLVSSRAKENLPDTEPEIKTHSWFTGFAPKKNPKVVVTLLVEYGGMGGATAAPLARRLFELYREKYD